LWLVIPKALTPGLSPILYHNDHGWTGSAAITELLQGTGAIATLASGLGALWILATFRRMSASWQVFAFWMGLRQKERIFRDIPERSLSSNFRFSN